MEPTVNMDGIQRRSLTHSRRRVVGLKWTTTVMKKATPTHSRHVNHEWATTVYDGKESRGNPTHPTLPLSRDESSREVKPQLRWGRGRFLIIPTYKSNWMDSAFSRSEIPCLYCTE